MSVKGVGSRHNSGGSECDGNRHHWNTRRRQNHVTSHADLLGESLDVLQQAARSSGGKILPAP